MVRASPYPLTEYSTRRTAHRLCPNQVVERRQCEELDQLVAHRDTFEYLSRLGRMAGIPPLIA